MSRPALVDAVTLWPSFHSSGRILRILYQFCDVKKVLFCLEHMLVGSMLVNDT